MTDIYYCWRGRVSVCAYVYLFGEGRGKGLNKEGKRKRKEEGGGAVQQWYVIILFVISSSPYRKAPKNKKRVVPGNYINENKNKNYWVIWYHSSALCSSLAISYLFNPCNALYLLYQSSFPTKGKGIQEGCCVNFRGAVRVYWDHNAMRKRRKWGWRGDDGVVTMVDIA